MRRTIIVPIVLGSFVLALAAYGEPQPRLYPKWGYAIGPDWMYERPSDFADRTWGPKPAAVGAALVAVKNCRVVDYGGRITRRHDHGSGQDGFRGSVPMTTITDVDGDGDKTGDCIAYHDFNFDVPMSPCPPGNDIDANNAVFYGGVVGFFKNNGGHSGFSEMGINTGEGMNNSIHTMGTSQPNSSYSLIVWKKEDFRDGGDKHRVSLDETSRIGLHVMRYWFGINQARYVVRNGDEWYISETNFGDDAAKDRHRQDKDDGGGMVIPVAPAKEKWAVYSPKAPYGLQFDRSKAQYETRTFDNVTAVGFYIAQDEFVALHRASKWYAFEMWATVHRPERPSESLNMAEIADAAVDGKQLPPFYVSRTEIPYTLFAKVQKWATAHQYVFHDAYPYVEEQDGDMGSMDYAPGGKLLKHHPDEPVTDITWLDAAVWCNMLSEFEGLEPVYYWDKEFKYIQRYAMDRVPYAGGGNEEPGALRPRLHVKWSANGYRLPTPAEWAAAFEPGADAWVESNSDGATHQVGASKPNRLGVHDMLGNVWEYIWDMGEALDKHPPKGFLTEHTVLGGDFLHPSLPMAKQANPYGDRPADGNFNIGFRIVRRKSDLPKPPLNMPAAIGKAIPSWTIAVDLVGKGAPVGRKDTPLLDMVEVPESSFVRHEDKVNIYVSPFKVARNKITYAKWKEVHDWAVARGYRFNFDGDMGSMKYRAGQVVHSPDEPVTGITRHDAMLWCNALSEMEGRKPCYRPKGHGEDDGRLLMVSPQEREYWSRIPPEFFTNPIFRFRGPKGEFDTMRKNGVDLGNYRMPWVEQWEHAIVDWSADGYRLPTLAEWTIACRAGTNTLYYWGDQPDVAGEHMWCAVNSGGTTQPVGLKKPNPLGLYDMLGNAFDYVWGGDNAGANQASHETWNPKGESSNMNIRGGSFINIPTRDLWNAFLASNEGRPWHTFWGWYANYDWSFRPVRCEARTHRKSGSEMPEEILILDVNLREPVTPLQGQTHRGNLQRTGVHYSKPVQKTPQIKWTFNTGSPVTGSPLCYQGVVYVASSNANLYALDAETGKERWRFKMVGAPGFEPAKNTRRPSAPTIKDNVLYIGCGNWGQNNGMVYAIDIRTGRPKWQASVKGAEWVTGSPLPAYGAVFVTMASHDKSVQEAGLVAIHGKTGQVLCVYKNSFWGAGYQPFGLAEGTIVGASNSGIAFVDLRSGSRMQSAPDNSSEYSMTVIQDNKIYTAGKAFVCTDIRSGKHDWIKPLEGTGWNDDLTISHMVLNSMAIWKNIAYMASAKGNLYAYETKSGKRNWKINVADGKMIRSAVSVATENPESDHAVAYCGSEDNRIFGIDLPNQTVLWETRLGGEVRSDIWPENGILYISCMDGNVYALSE